MNYKNFLWTTKIIFCLVYTLEVSASLSKAQLLWGEGDFTKNDTELSLQTKKDDNYFISVPFNGLNLDKEAFYFEFLISNIPNLQGLEIRFSESKNSENYYSFTLPYFSDPDFNFFKENQWAKFGLSKGNLETVGISPKKINFVSFFLFTKNRPMIFKVRKIDNRKKVSNGFVSITFDDGYSSNFLAGKLTKKYGLAGTAYIMPRDVGQGNTLMNLKQIKELKSMGWDIQSHHGTALTEMTEKQIKTEIEFGLKYLKDNKLDSSTSHFAYPLGKHNQKIVNIISKYFDTARLAGGGMETAPLADPLRVRTFNVLDTTRPEEIKELAKKTMGQNQWLILMFHYLKKKPANQLQYNIEDFEEICKILKELKVPVLTVDQVYRKYLK